MQTYSASTLHRQWLTNNAIFKADQTGRRQNTNMSICLSVCTVPCLCLHR